MPLALHQARRRNGKPLTPGHKVLAAEMWRHVHNWDGESEAWVFVEQETLRKRIGIANGTLHDQLNELEELGLVVRRRGRTPSGRRKLGYQLRPTGSTAPEAGVAAAAEDLQSTGGGEPPAQATTSGPPEVQRPPAHRRSRPPAEPRRTSSPPEAYRSSEAHEKPTPLEAPRGAPLPSPLVPFALTPPEPEQPTKAERAKATQRRREGQALALWRVYERHRAAKLPGARERAQPADGEVRSIVRLVDHVAKTEGRDEDAAWSRVVEYGERTVEEAAEAKESARTPAEHERARKLCKWRADGNAFRVSRFDTWRSFEEAGPKVVAQVGAYMPQSDDWQPEEVEVS